MGKNKKKTYDTSYYNGSVKDIKYYTKKCYIYNNIYNTFFVSEYNISIDK